MQLGVYDTLSNEDYHSGPGVNKGLLDLVAKSPAHAKWWLDMRASAANENAPKSKALRFGSALHALVLEPDAFAASYIVAPEGAPARPTSRQIAAKKTSPETVAAIEYWAAFDAEHGGKEILSADDMATLHGTADSIRRHPAAGRLLAAPGRSEVSAYWIDQPTGELCRCRPDRMRQDGIIVDLKSTICASEEEFARSIAKYRYHVQAAWYLDGVEAATGRAPAGFVFVAVEKTPPYLVGVYCLTPTDIEIGRAQYREDLNALAQCKKLGQWPGYGDSITAISLPGYYYQKNAHLMGE